MLHNNFPQNVKQTDKTNNSFLHLKCAGECFYSIHFERKNVVVLETGFQCNFDRDTCGFVQRKDDQFDWTRRSGRTPSSYTGPFSGAGGTGMIHVKSRL